jgi:malate synthase
VFEYSEQALGLSHGTIKATALIETLPAVFQMHEILYEMSDYLVGLNCGRWDYIFSYIKTFREHPDRVLPERGQIDMTVPFLHNYSRLLIDTCHRRGAFAIGGMAAQIPIKGDTRANSDAMEKVKQDKYREVKDGHDGTWVAHPGLIPLAMEIFDQNMPQANQLERPLSENHICRDDLICPSEGTITTKGLRQNIEVSLTYLVAWLMGNGCVPIHHLMEDVATTEISRCQIWQWIKHASHLEDGRVVSAELVFALIDSVSEELEKNSSDSQYQQILQKAVVLFAESVTAKVLPDFLTLKAYEFYE